MDDDEEVLWEDKGSIAYGKDSNNFTEGKFIMTNRKMVLQRRKKALLGLVDMGNENVWSIDIEDITDIEVQKRSLLGAKRCYIKGSGKVYALKIKDMSADKIEKKIGKLIRDSKKRFKDDDFNRELELRKASRSEVNINLGGSKQTRKNDRSLAECFACGELIDPEDMEWIGPGKIRCPECNSKIVLK